MCHFANTFVTVQSLRGEPELSLSNAPLSLKWLPLYCEITNVVKVVTVEEVVFHKC